MIEKYNFIKTIQENGENADVFLIEDKLGQKFILKKFNKAVKSHIPYGKINHFGRRREGNELVFNEIKNVSERFSFLINFYERFKWGNKWCIVIEYFNGITFNHFLNLNKNSEKKISEGINSFAKEVKLWHQNNFALGDPHLGNVLINNKTSEIKLVDYSQLHYPGFKFCEKYDCFKSNSQKRIKEDLKNDSGKFGKGFIEELILAKKENGININLEELFLKEYEN